jgi:pimeloyl-ACP methyl ester carboxylesterase
MAAAGFRPRREPGSPVPTSAGPVFVARRRAPRARRRPLVLVHGWLMAHGYFSAIVDAFRGERELVLVDLPGHGESSCPPRGEFAYDFDAFVGVVGEVLDRLGLAEVDLLGHSLGGGIALRVAEKRSSVVDLALVAPLVYRIPEPVAARVLAIPAIGPFLWEHGARRHDFVRQIKHDMSDPDVAGDAFVDWVYRGFSRPGGRAATYATFSVARAIPVDTEVPSRVSQRTLVLWGDTDRLIPLSHGRRLVDTLPNGRLAIVPACGHTPFVERPSYTADQLRDFFAEAA